MAGERVQCSKCGGEYFEPTDPLPGILPEKAPEIDRSGQAIGLAPSSEAVPTAPTSTDILAQLKLGGYEAVVITKGADNQAVSVTFSENLTEDQANDLILRSAVDIMKTRWPDIYQLAANRVFS